MKYRILTDGKQFYVQRQERWLCFAWWTFLVWCHLSWADHFMKEKPYFRDWDGFYKQATFCSVAEAERYLKHWFGHAEDALIRVQPTLRTRLRVI